jgi:hypothetical protein
MRVTLRNYDEAHKIFLLLFQNVFFPFLRRSEQRLGASSSRRPVSKDTVARLLFDPTPWLHPIASPEEGLD